MKSFAAAGALAVGRAGPRFAFAATPDDRRLVVVILRGALDGLAAAPPHGDKDYAAVRGDLALRRPAPAPLHDLDGFFGLHPALTNLKALYDAKELVVFHNICSPYRDRSHFDGQNVLESGGTSRICCRMAGSIARFSRWGLPTATRRSAIAQIAAPDAFGQGAGHQLDAGGDARARRIVPQSGARALCP